MAYVNKNCERCGKILENVHTSTKYCSECKKIAQKKEKKPVNKKCKNCGEMMYNVIGHRKYCVKCSKKLFAYDSRSEKETTAKCAVCGATITNYKSGPKRCSKCREKNKNKAAQKKEYLTRLDEKVQLRRLRKRLLNVDFSESIKAGMTYGEYMAQKDMHIYQSQQVIEF